MNADEIILQDAANAGVDAESLLKGIKRQLASGEATVLRAGNSVLVLKRIGNGAALLHLFTVDNGMGVARAVQTFIQKIRQSDIKVVYGKANNEQILKLLRMLGVDVTESDLPEFNWRAEV